MVGIDLAGPETHTLELGARGGWPTAICSRGRAPPALGTTVHTGETAHTAAPGVLAVLEELAPARIGHGVAAAAQRGGGAQARRAGDGAGDLPELEPAHARGGDLAELGTDLARRSRAAGCASPSTPTALTCSTRTCGSEFEMLLDAGILSEAEVERSIAVARAATFIR